MRNEDEIIKAHDILDAIVEGDIPFRTLTGNKLDQLRVMTTARNILCWILKHEREKWFEERILELEAELLAKGYELKDIRDEPFKS